MKKNAFTMLELVFVIIVLGILAAMTLSRMERDLKQEAIDNILSAIRYTQHLALMDNKHSFNDPKWQQKFWKIQFTTSAVNTLGNFYTISSDADYDQVVDKSETVLDPANGKYMYNTSGATVAMDPDESPNIFIGKKYGVNTLNAIGDCANSKTIGFDHLGRPHVGFLNSNTPDYRSYMAQDCTLAFSSSTGAFNGNFQIRIAQETGYACLLDGAGNCTNQ